MPVTVNWLNDKKNILYFDYVGLWEWEESYSIIAQSNIMMEEVNHPVGSIVDFTNTSHVPDNLADAMKKIAELRDSHPNDSGETVYVNAKILTKAMFDIIQITQPEIASIIKFTHAKSVDEAEQILLSALKKSQNQTAQAQR